MDLTNNNNNIDDLNDIDKLKNNLIPASINPYQKSSNINRPKVISLNPTQNYQNIDDDDKKDKIRVNNHQQKHKMRDLLSQNFTYNKPKTTSLSNNIKRKRYDIKTYYTNDNRKKISSDNISVKSFNYNRKDKYKIIKDNVSAKSFEESYSVINQNNNDDLKFEIKLDDLILYDERLNDILMALNTNNGKSPEPDASNECAEFFVFYFHSSLQQNIPLFYKEKNKIIIESANNLTLLSIIITYHLSLIKDIFKNVINMIINIFSLLKMNLSLNAKKIMIAYGETFAKKNDFYFKTFNYYLNKQNLINAREEDIIIKLEHNCRLITIDIKKILKIYKEKNNNYYKDFLAIFNNISILTEEDLKTYFYSRVCGIINKNKENQISNNLTKRKISIKRGTKQNNNNIINNNQYHKNNGILKNSKSTKNLDRSDVISVKSTKSSNYFGKIDKHNNKILKLINEYEKNKIEAPFIKTPNRKKYSIVFDLDETLINIEFKDLTNNKCILHFRPGLFKFLSDIQPYYELMTFTSASKEYAQPIINEIESKNKYFDFNFFREHSIIFGNDFVKDISRIGRDMKKIIIIDNMEENFRLNKKNGIKIYPFYGNKNDNVLFELENILIAIYKQGYEDLTIALNYYSKEIKKKITLEG
jgi:Dullard-like phosphatase family protein